MYKHAVDAHTNRPPAPSARELILSTPGQSASVLYISETEEIRILHPSFHDYLTERCRVKPWSIDPELHNKELALRCIKLLDNELRENICDMTLPF
jgi:hypothetical protein